MVDQNRAEADRTLDLCSVFECRADPVVYVLAAVRWGGLVGRGSYRAARIAWVVCVWLGTDPLLDFPDQSLRLVWHASGVAIPSWPNRYCDAVCDSWSISSRATPALYRLAVCVLDDARDDVCAPAVLNSNDRLHSVGHPIRRTRSGSRVWGRLRRVQASGADACSVSSQARF